MDLLAFILKIQACLNGTPEPSFKIVDQIAGEQPQLPLPVCSKREGLQYCIEESCQFLLQLLSYKTLNFIHFTLS